MLIQDSDFPIVRMHYDQAGAEGDLSGLARFDELLSQTSPFVLIGLGASDEAHKHTPEERKQMALWMKRNREPLRRLVKAMVYVEPHAAKRLVAKAQALVFAKGWGFPMIVAASEGQALTIAERLLAGVPVSTIESQAEA